MTLTYWTSPHGPCLTAAISLKQTNSSGCWCKTRNHNEKDLSNCAFANDSMSADVVEIDSQAGSRDGQPGAFGFASFVRRFSGHVRQGRVHSVPCIGGDSKFLERYHHPSHVSFQSSHPESWVLNMFLKGQFAKLRANSPPLTKLSHCQVTPEVRIKVKVWAPTGQHGNVCSA